MLDDVYFLTSLPSPIDYVLQFRMNFACDSSVQESPSSSSVTDYDSEYHVVVQFSTDHGQQWNNLHNLCLMPACSGVPSPVQVSFVFAFSLFFLILAFLEYVVKFGHLTSLGTHHFTDSVRCFNQSTTNSISSERWFTESQQWSSFLGD